MAKPLFYLARGSGGTSRLPAPANISVEVAGSGYEVTFDAVVGAASYEWRLDGTGSWTNIATATSFSGSASAGSHSVQVRALDSGAVAGHIGTSGAFTIDTPSGVAADMAFDFSGATPGALLTTAILAASKIGGSGWSQEYVVGPSHTDPALTQTTVETDGSAPSYSEPFLIGSTPYSSSDDRVIVSSKAGRAGNDGMWEGWAVQPPGATISESVCVAGFVKFAVTTSAEEVYLDQIMIQGGGYVVMQMRATTEPICHALCHTDGGGGGVYGLAVVIDPTKWYRFDLRCDLVNGYGELLLRDGATLVLASRNPTSSTSVNIVEFFTGYLNCYGGETRYKGLVCGVGVNATFPMGSFTPTSPSSVTASQTSSNEITLAWAGQGFDFKIERNKNGAGYTILTSSQASSPYVDTALVDTDSVIYRVTAQINAHSSSASVSNSGTPVVISDGVTLLLDEGFEGTGTPSGWFISAFGGEDPDYITSPIAGAQSLRLGNVSEPNYALSPSISPVPSVWVKFRFRIDELPASFNTFFIIYGASDQMAVFGVLADGTLYAQDQSGFLAEATVDAVTQGENYYGWFQYRAATGVGANDGVSRIWFNDTDAKPLSSSNKSAGGTTARGVEGAERIGLLCGANHGVVIFDSVQLAASSFE